MATPAEIVVLIDSVIEARLNGGDVMRAARGYDSLQKSSYEDLIALRKHYQGLAAQAGAAGSRTNYATFEEPT